MGLKLIYESLEIEKLLEEEQAAREKGSVAEQTLEEKKVQEVIKENKEEDEGDGADPSVDTQETEGNEGSGEDPSSTSPETEGGRTDGEGGETSEVKPDDPQTSSDDTPTQESLREIAKGDLALEAFGENGWGSGIGGALKSGVSTGVGVVVDALTAGVRTLVSLTATHGPTILKSLYKGVIYSLAKTVSALDKSYRVIDTTIERRKNSVDTLKDRLETLKGMVRSIESSEEPVEDLSVSFGKRDVIDALKCGENVNLVNNLRELDKFLVATIGKLHRSTLDDIAGLQRLTTLYATNRGSDAVQLLQVSVTVPGMVAGEVAGHEVDTELLTTYKSHSVLPGDAVVVADLPNTSLRSVEEYEAAYKQSQMYVGFDKRNYHQVNEVQLKGFSVVKELVSVLESLVRNYETQQTLYEDIRNTKPGVMLSIKKHAMRLVESNTKIRYSDSLVGPLYAKSAFIAKVYLAGSLEIHDYAARTISNGLSLAEELAKKYG